MPGNYVVGSRAIFTATFKNAAGGLIDPTALSLTVMWQASPQLKGQPRTYVYGVDVELVRESLGKFQLEKLLDQVGKYLVRWHSSGAGQEAVIEDFVSVAAKGF